MASGTEQRLGKINECFRGPQIKIAWLYIPPWEGVINDLSTYSWFLEHWDCCTWSKQSKRVVDIFVWWGTKRSREPSLASAELLVQLLSPQTRTCACDPVFKWVNSTLREKIHSRMQQGQHCSYLSHRDLWNGTVSSSSLNKLQCLTRGIALTKRVDGVCLLHLLIYQARKAI